VRRAVSRAFTLIELMVVLAVIALAATLAVPAMASITGANARAAAGEVAGTLRALFEYAALRHATCRLVIDIDARASHAECARGRAAAPRSESDLDLADRFPGEKDEVIRKLLARTSFGAIEDRLVKKRTLPGQARFGPVVLEGRQHPVESGTAVVSFFPGGRAQAARIPIVDGDHHYTVVLEPLTGRARVVAGEVKE
jgi:general secretion pathway protein H